MRLTAGQKLIVTALALLALLLTALLEPTHDYRHYMVQWNAVVSDAKWPRTNSYGPTHNAFALLWAIQDNLPKFAFGVMWVVSAWLLFAQLMRNSHLPAVHLWLCVAAVLLNPMFWIFGPIYGTNDIVMGCFTLFGLLLYLQKKDVWSGAFIAAAIGIKFIPLAMLPFLVLDKSRIRWSFAISVTLFMVLIFGAGYLLWGDNMIWPFDKAVNRNSKYLSIFRFLRGDYSPLLLFQAKPNVDWISIYLCVVSVGLHLLVHLKYRLEPVLSSIIAVMLLITFYKVGHHQFYITPFFAIVAWIAMGYSEERNMNAVLNTFYCMIVWMGTISVIFYFTNYYSGTPFKDAFGLPNFILSLWLIYHLYRFAIHHRNNELQFNARKN